MPPASLLQKISSREARVSVVGLGYVGLPLAMAFVAAGFDVEGIDIDEARVSQINLGSSSFDAVPKTELFGCPLQTEPSPHFELTLIRREGRLTAGSSFDVLLEADVAIICVPTPLNKTKDPDLSYIIGVMDELRPRLHRGMLIILESTTYPGTTQELLLPKLAEVDGKHFEVGSDFHLAFSPERIDPGSKDWTVTNTPKVVAGATEQCLTIALALYGCIIDELVPVSSTKTAEMVKLLENTFRAVNIGLVNELAIMCDRLGVDIWEVIGAAETKPYGYMPFYPGPGLGGHCIPVDPAYLAWKLRSLNYNARFVQLASEVNFSMPRYVVEKAVDALNERRLAVNGSKVLVVGVSYKANVSDLRESPALDVLRLLKDKGALVSYHDPYVPVLDVGEMHLVSIDLEPEVLSAVDCVVVTTAHSCINWSLVACHSSLVVDTRNALKNLPKPLLNVVGL